MTEGEYACMVIIADGITDSIIRFVQTGMSHEEVYSVVKLG
jgi:hypothetical protein